MLMDGIISLLTGQPGGSSSSYTAQVAAVVAILGANVYEDVLPRGDVFPAVAIHQYNGSQDSQFSGPVGVREDQLQFDFYGTTALQARQARAVVRTLLVGTEAAPGFLGTLPDGTVVQAIFLDREVDMPFLPHADKKGLANRKTLGLRVISAA